MNGNRDPLRQEADTQAWRGWGTPLSGLAASRDEAAAIAARLSPAPERPGALAARAETGAAILYPRRTARDSELVQIHAEVGRYYQSLLSVSWVPGYLASRGLAAALLPTSPWKIGYAPASWAALTEHLRRLGHCDAALLCSGLVTTGSNGQLRDRFHDRLMIPLRDQGRVVTGFTGRRHPDAGEDRGPKYLNSPSTALFTKGHVLAGLAEGHRALRAGAQPVLVEGPLDVIAVAIAAPGQFTGVTPCGTALTGEQAALLARAVDLPDRGLRVALDADPAGRKAAVRAYSHLADLTGDLTAVILPDGRDPAEILQNDGPAALQAALAGSVRPLADLVVDARIQEWSRGHGLVFAEQQMGALRAAATVIAAMPAGQVGPQAARLAALYSGRYGWHPEEVTREIIDAVDRYYQPDRETTVLPQPAATAVQQAIAPPRQRSASVHEGTEPRPMHSAQRQSRERA
jgi:DNA primase